MVRGGRDGFTSTRELLEWILGVGVQLEQFGVIVEILSVQGFLQLVPQVVKQTVGTQTECLAVGQVDGLLLSCPDEEHFVDPVVVLLDVLQKAGLLLDILKLEQVALVVDVDADRTLVERDHVPEADLLEEGFTDALASEVFTDEGPRQYDAFLYASHVYLLVTYVDHTGGAQGGGETGEHALCVYVDALEPYLLEYLGHK